MSKTKKIWMAAGALMVLFIFIVAGTIFYNNSRLNPEDEAAHLATYLIEQDNIHNRMLNDMSITSSGNADLDFLIGMQIHHQAAVNMCESYLTHGSSRKLKRTVRKIIKETREEIAEMEQLSDILVHTSSDPEACQIYMDAYNNMLSLTNHTSHGTSTDMTVEEAFAQGMIKHHQMAIDMSDSILSLTGNSEIKEMAQEIMENQTEEMQIMLAVQ